MAHAKSGILKSILADTRAAIARSRGLTPDSEIQLRAARAKPPRSLERALRESKGLIAEIKVRSPSMGSMRPENVATAPAAYENSAIVRAVSVLTNETFFGQSIDRLGELRALISKPILRKDFIIDEYQIFEARAYGADAILLMTTILNAEELRRLGDCAQSLGLDVLYEAHDEQEITMLPDGARICGINSRKLDSRRLGLQHWLRRFLPLADHSIVSDRYSLADRLPAGSVRVAESGLSSENVGRVLQNFDAALVGTSLLLAADGVQAELMRFERALKRDPTGPGIRMQDSSQL